MTDEKVNLQGCPRSDCDDPIIEAFRTDQPFQIRKQNMVADKWCIVPRLDPGNEAYFTYVVRHGEPEGFKTGAEVRDEEEATTDEGEGATTEDELQEDTTTEGEEEADDGAAAPAESDESPEQADVGVIHTDDLSDLERRCYELLMRQARPNEKKDSLQRGEVAGKLLDAGYAPSEVGAALKGLCEMGAIVEIDDAVYKVVSEDG